MAHLTLESQVPEHRRPKFYTPGGYRVAKTPVDQLPELDAVIAVARLVLNGYPSKSIAAVVAPQQSRRNDEFHGEFPGLYIRPLTSLIFSLHETLGDQLIEVPYMYIRNLQLSLQQLLGQ